VEDEELVARIYRLAHPVVLLALIINATFGYVYQGLRAWMNSIRDEEYLVGERLHNLNEPIIPSSNQASAETESTANSRPAREMDVNPEQQTRDNEHASSPSNQSEHENTLPGPSKNTSPLDTPTASTTPLAEASSSVAVTTMSSDS
jgi:hypothetical protein